MEDERNTPQEEDEVEAHKRGGAASPEEPGRNALDDDDDEVEAHKRAGAASPEEPKS